MKINFKFIIFSVFTFIIFFSCKKTDFKSSSNIETTNNIEEKFFNNYRSTDPSEKKLVDFIKKQNDKLHFVEKTANQIGYPRWNKAVVIKKASTSFTNSSDSSTNIYYIPFVRDSQNYVNASMQITTSTNDSSFTYLQDWQYKNLQNNLNSYTDSAETLAIFFMFLDKNVFGNNVFNILDSNLFRVNNQKPTFVRLDSVAATSFNFLYPIVTCIPGTILFPCSVLGGNINGQNSPTSNTAACSVSWNYCFISGIYNDDPTGNTTTGGGGGGTSNGGPSSGPTGGGSGGSGVGWTPVPLNPTVIYIQNALGLDGFEPSWLATHSQRATEIKNYLVQNNNSLASKIIATQHLVRMMIDTEYLAFVPTHLQTGNSR